MEGIIATIMVFSIPLTAIIGGLYIKVQKMKMQNGGGNNEMVNDLRKEVGSLMAENEEIKNRLKNLEYIMTDDDRRIDLDYEKEQIRLDEKNKFNH